MFETALLLITAVWIIYEAVQRLFYKPVEVEVSVWAFLVMIVSIVIDFTRSRILYKAARAHNSQALEADALHFSTDIWSSSVVILGLIFVWISKIVPSLRFLEKADAIAASVVALIVVYVSVEMGLRTINGLLDTAPKGLADRIRNVVEATPGVSNCHKVRVRYAGPLLFVDAHVLVDGEQTLAEAHALTERIEEAVNAIVPGADVTVHPEPAPGIETPEPGKLE